MLCTNRAGVCAADRDGLQGVKRSNSRSYCEHLQRRRPPEAADVHDAMVREEHPYGLGHSDMAQRYAIQSLAEAQAYLEHPVLAGRLRECCQILLDLETSSALDVLGSPDDLKLRSSMTLFGEASAPGSVFEAVLQKYFGGEKDPRTVQLLVR